MSGYGVLVLGDPDLVGGEIWNSSEFQDGKTATCGVETLADAYAWATQEFVAMLAVFNPMHAAGRCDANGAAKTSGVAAQAKADRYQIDVQDDGTGYALYKPFLLKHLPHRVVAVEVAVGQAFHDYLSDSGEDATNLRFHFVCFVGYHAGGYSKIAGKVLPEGYWVVDPDSDVVNPVVDGHRQHLIGTHRLCFYPIKVVSDAQPCGAVAIYPKVAIPTPVPAQPQGDDTVTPIDLTNAQVKAHFKQGANPGQWACTDPAHPFNVQGLLLDFYRKFGGDALNGLTYLGLPLTGEIHPVDGYAGCFQVFERGAGAYDPEHRFDNPPGSGQVYLMHIGQGPVFDQLAAALTLRLTQAQAQIAALAQQVSDDKQADAKLHALLDAARAQAGSAAQALDAFVLATSPATSPAA